MTYIFRNHTLEPFFNENYRFSGYDDLTIDDNADNYIWWYQIPYKYDNNILLHEINTFYEKLEYLVKNIEKKIVVFTLYDVFSVNVEGRNNLLKFTVAQFNQRIYTLAQNFKNVKVVDISSFLSEYNRNEIVDWRYYFNAFIPYSPRLIPAFQIWWQKQQKQLLYQRKKCLILDLDNTLWSGILGEDGVYGIQMSGDYPGKAFGFWQEGLLNLRRNGVLLAICSKNNLEDVEDVWQLRNDMLLRKDDFVAYRINWREKSSNIVEIAQELNIGLDSLVFVDDNPVERELVKQQLPMVEVPDFPNQPYSLPIFYKKIVDDYFRIYALTQDDKEKTQQYIENKNRIEYKKSFENIEDYLKSLNIRLQIVPLTDSTIQRAVQLTQKTNQFNLTTRRYSEDDVTQFIIRGGRCWTLNVSDKFGDNGITGLIIVDDNLNIDTFLLSCRILGRGIENVFLGFVLNWYKERGVSYINAEYRPTLKNKQVENFYSDMGFVLTKETSEYKAYRISLEKFEIKNNDIYKIN